MMKRRTGNQTKANRSDGRLSGAAPFQKNDDPYREIVENANAIILEMDAQGIITLANQYALKFFGYSEDELLGRDVRTLLPTVESGEGPQGKWIDEFLRDPDGYIDHINENVLKDGTVVWISWRNKAIRDARGRVTGNLALGQDITPLIRAEEALRANERRLRSLFENNVDGMMITIPDGTVLAANAKMCEMLGMTEEELVRLGRKGVVVEDEDLRAGLEVRSRTGKFLGELTFRRKDGSLMPAEVSSVCFKDADGTLKTGQVVRDITQRKRSEEALKQAYGEMEQRVAQRTAEIKEQSELLDLAYDAIIAREEGGKILFWNAGAEETYGWTKAEAMKQSLCDLLRTQYPMPLKEIMAQVKETGRWEGELTQVHKVGTPIVVLSRWTLRQEDEGAPAKIMEVNRDISLRKATELALRKVGAYNRSLIEASLDPMVTIGPDGKITDANAAVEVITGYPRKALIGSDFSRYFTDAERAKTVYEMVFKQGFVRGYELELKDRHGHVIPVLYNARIYKDESGDVIGVFTASRDVSELKQAEKEILAKSKALEELNTALKVLIDHYRNDQRELDERVTANIRLRVIPYLEKLRQTLLDPRQTALLEVIERAVRDLTSPFVTGMTRAQYRFTPNEVEVISLIKEGKTTKEIAQILHKGVRTVDSCRDNIRRKLGITQDKINLRTYLLSTLNTDDEPVK